MEKLEKREKIEKVVFPPPKKKKNDKTWKNQKEKEFPDGRHSMHIMNLHLAMFPQTLAAADAAKIYILQMFMTMPLQTVMT
jgi:hypothetical protein